MITTPTPEIAATPLVYHVCSPLLLQTSQVFLSSSMMEATCFNAFVDGRSEEGLLLI